MKGEPGFAWSASHYELVALFAGFLASFSHQQTVLTSQQGTFSPSRLFAWDSTRNNQLLMSRVTSLTLTHPSTHLGGQLRSHLIHHPAQQVHTWPTQDRVVVFAHLLRRLSCTQLAQVGQLARIHLSVQLAQLIQLTSIHHQPTCQSMLQGLLTVRDHIKLIIVLLQSLVISAHHII